MAINHKLKRPIGVVKGDRGRRQHAHERFKGRPPLGRGPQLDRLTRARGQGAKGGQVVDGRDKDGGVVRVGSDRVVEPAKGNDG